MYQVDQNKTKPKPKLTSRVLVMRVVVMTVVMVRGMEVTMW